MSKTFDKIVEFLLECDETMTADSVGRAIAQAYGDRKHLVVEGINRHD